jgi:type 1 glutamine amidotransferase
MTRLTFRRIPLLILLCGLAAFSQTRKRSQVETILGPATDTAGPFAPLNIVLVYGTKDHAAGQHEYVLFAQQWQPLLSKMQGAKVTTANYWPSQAQWDSADLVVLHLRTHNCNSNTGTSCTPSSGTAQLVDSAKFTQLDAFLNRGKGIVTVHPGNYPHEIYQDKWADRTGVVWRKGTTTATTTTYREGHLTLNFRKLSGHPMLTGLPGLPDTLQFEDEMYFPLFGHPDSIQTLATSNETFQSVTSAHPALWTYTRPGKPGRAYGFIMGHLHTSFSDPVFRLLLMRGMAWASNDNFARYRRVVLDGATYVNDVVALKPPVRAQILPQSTRFKGIYFERNGETWQSDGRKLLEAPKD